MLNRLTKWWARQVDIQTLEALDDRMLADIGLGREEIRARVLGAAPSPARPGPAGLARRPI